MKKTLYNLNQLVSVEIRDRKICLHLTYKPFKKSFWSITKEGFYEDYSDWRYTKEDIENGSYNKIKFIVEDNVVYYYPYVKLIFAGEVDMVREFKTYQEALGWGEKMSLEGMKKILEKDGVDYKIINN